MNASPFPASSTTTQSLPENAAAEVSVAAVPRRRSRSSILYSLTGVCFVFGALVALQFRAIQQMHANEKIAANSQVEAKQRADALALKLADGEKVRQNMQAKMDALQVALNRTGSLSKTQVAALNAQIKELQLLAGLTPVSGPGIRIVMSDNPQAAQTAQAAGQDTAFLPGIVHDYDILQVVNELRAAGAEAISVNGIRITGYTPIRCVGPAILINGRPVPAPFRVEAIGSPEGLLSAVTMANGIVDNLKTSGGIQVKINEISKLELSDAGALPSLKVAKPAPKGS